MMLKYKYIKTFILAFFISFGIMNQAYCLDKTITKSYTDDNGNSYNISFIFREDRVNPLVGGSFNGDDNYIEVDNEGNTIHEGYYYENRRTFIVNSEGQILARKPNWNAAIDETYQYTEGGKVLRYNASGQLIGAYEDYMDAIVVANRNRDDSLFNNSDSFDDYDSDGKIIGTYYQNGDYIKNLYNDKGDLISSNKYNKDGDILESAVNKYDSGGNLTAAYKDGVATYRRTSYTPAEAAAAIKKGNNNKVTLTFK